MTEPDFDKLSTIGAELDQLADGGRLTRADFERLFEEAKKAVGKHTQFLEGVLMTGLEFGFVKH